jgi:hypothetical protein
MRLRIVLATLTLYFLPYVATAQPERPRSRLGHGFSRRKKPQNKAAARDATDVSTVRGGRRVCNCAGRQELVEGAPVSGMPLVRLDAASL